MMQLYQVPIIYALSNNTKNHLHSFDNCNFKDLILNWCACYHNVYTVNVFDEILHNLKDEGTLFSRVQEP